MGSVNLDNVIFSEYTFSKEILDLALRYGYEPDIMYRYVEILGFEGAVMLVNSNNTPLPETFRCNDYLIDCNDLVKRLESKGFKLEKLQLAPHGFRVLYEPIPIGATHEYLLGYYYIQDPGSMLVVYILEPEPGELILDMAAAPGGKATQILQLTRDKARLVAVDISRRRLRALRSHMQRMGFTNYLIVKANSRMLPEDLKYDRVLLDAPSSGEGIIRKDPKRKMRGRREDIKRIHELQYSLLMKAYRLTREDGVIVYAACSTAVEEGEYVINKLLESTSNIYVEKPKIEGLSSGITSYRGVEFNSEVSKCSRLWPHIHGTEGFFICRLRVSRR
ncbi:MAG: RsmB/NOP family class I SAM-dependent RNA methyltransferase [Acidilobaceae archaeon]